MNMFLDHHRDIIRFAYSCFDRIILSGHIQALQMGGQVASFLWYQRQIGELSRHVLK